MKTHRKHFLLSLFSMATILSVILAACGYVKVFNGSGGKKLKWNAETGYQVETETDKLSECVAALDVTKLTFSNSDISTAVTGDITLPATILDCSVSWSVDSSVSGWISISGTSATITRVDSETNGSITLVGAVTYGSSAQNKDLSITILRKNVTDEEKVAACVAAFPASPFTFASGDSVSNIYSAFTALTAQNDCGVTWSLSAGLTWLSVSGGTFTRTSTTSGSDQSGTITATISRNSASDSSKTFNVTVKGGLAEVNNLAAALDSSSFTFTAPDTASSVTQNFTLPVADLAPLPSCAPYTCNIVWTEVSDTLNAVSYSSGLATVTRPTYASGNATVTLKATVTRSDGLSYSADSSNISVTVKRQAPTTAEAVAACKTNLTIADFQGSAPPTSGNPSGTAGTLPTVAPWNGTFTVPVSDTIGDAGATTACTISWVSDSTPHVSFSSSIGTFTNFHDGDVSSGAGKTITATATIFSGVTVDSKAFTLTMVKRGTLSIATIDKMVGIGGGSADYLFVSSANSDIDPLATISYKVCIGPDSDTDLASISAMIQAATDRDLGTCATAAGSALVLSTTDTHCCTTNTLSSNRHFRVPTHASQTWRARIYSYVAGEPNVGDHKILYDLSTTAVNP